jgi:peptidoglycan/xylan/chitin deacetylase (PgdA/CDA1 family)
MKCLSLLALALFLQAVALPAAGPWPERKTYAVSLTYDDGLESQILNAAYELDTRGLKASFYPTGNSTAVKANPEPWKQLVLKGHELGSHTMLHSCGEAQGRSFLQPADYREAYTAKRYAAELDQSLAFLKGLGAKGPWTLAWPCGQAWVGQDHEDVTPLAAERFRAARDAWGTLVDPGTVDLMHVGCVDGAKPAPVLLSWVKDAKREGKWLVFIFHGVGGDYLAVDNDAHAALLDALTADKEAWVAPFGKVAARVADWQKKR